MPGREIPLVNNEIYHVFNRGIASQPIFGNKRDYSRLIETFIYYQNIAPPVKYSKFLTLSTDTRAKIIDTLRRERKFLVEIIAYCLMPNHFHFILKQTKDNGISSFIGNISNSYTRFFNTKNERQGPLLAGKFKSVRVITENQLLHLSRYIHLNPYTSYVVKTTEDLSNYLYSSFPEYTGEFKTAICLKEDILTPFKNKESYKKFVFDRADYQRRLEEIKHLTFED